MEEEQRAILFACFGGFSNVGVMTSLASLDAVRKVGLDKACIGCLSGLPTGLESVEQMTKNAKCVVTIDGCDLECAKKIVENTGAEITSSIVLTRDLDIKKRSLWVAGSKGQKIDEALEDNDMKKARDLIISKITTSRITYDNNKPGPRENKNERMGDEYNEKGSFPLHPQLGKITNG